MEPYSLPPKRITDPDELAAAKVEWDRKTKEAEQEARQIAAMMLTFVAVIFFLVGIPVTGMLVKAIWGIIP